MCATPPHPASNSDPVSITLTYMATPATKHDQAFTQDRRQFETIRYPNLARTVKRQIYARVLFMQSMHGHEWSHKFVAHYISLTY